MHTGDGGIDAHRTHFSWASARALADYAILNSGVWDNVGKLSFLFHYGDRIGLLAEHMDAISGIGIGVYRELESFKRARGLMSMALEVICFEYPFDHGRLSLNLKGEIN